MGGGGCFEAWKQHQTISTQILIDLQFRFSRFFSPNLGDLQKHKKLKKVFSRAETQFFRSKSHHVLDQFSSPKLMGGATFAFGAKIGLKSAKNGVFYILFRPMGGYSPPPLSGYATGLPTPETNVLPFD